MDGSPARQAPAAYQNVSNPRVVTSAAVTLFVDFNTLVIGHGLDPMTVHRELLKIDEYRRMIPPDHR